MSDRVSSLGGRQRRSIVVRTQKIMDGRGGPVVRALVLQHDLASAPGTVGRRLSEHGFDLDVLVITRSLADPVFTGAFPDPAVYDVVVVLGAIWSVYDRVTIGSWIDRELDLLRRATANDVPVLGVCFGAQALASVHGAAVTAALRPEIGYRTVTTHAPDLIAEGPWMQWHTDRFCVPDGAVELASSDVGPQAFRIGRSLGVQFHPEVQPEIIGRWLELGGGHAADALAEVDLTCERLLDDARRYAGSTAAAAARMVDGFLSGIARL
jgi:GMP synthase-like glutamine amidotransferase